MRQRIIRRILHWASIQEAVLSVQRLQAMTVRFSTPQKLKSEMTSRLKWRAEPNIAEADAHVKHVIVHQDGSIALIPLRQAVSARRCAASFTATSKRLNTSNGYITKANRYQLGVGKDHYLDACVIATQGKPFTIHSRLYKKTCISDGDFQKTKGIRSEKPINTGKICGYRKFDKVRYYGKDYFIKGRMTSGYAVLMDIDGKKIDFSGQTKVPKTPKLSHCIRKQARTTWMITNEAVTPNMQCACI